MAKPEQEPTKPAKYPIWLTISLTLIVFFAASMALRGRGGKDADPEIFDRIQYEETLDKVEKSTAEIMVKVDQEKELTEEEIKVLRQAMPDIRALTKFASTHFGIYHLKAKVHFGLREFPEALEACTKLYELGPTVATDDVIAVVAETRYIASRSNLMMNRLEEAIAEAKAGIKIQPNIPKLRFALASAYIQAKKDKEAIEALRQAASDRVVDERLIDLLNFLTKPRKEDEAPKAGQTRAG